MLDCQGLTNKRLIDAFFSCVCGVICHNDIMINRKKWLNHLRIRDFSRDRKVAWEKLPKGFIPWETFKRLANQFGIDKAIERAEKMIDKQS